MKRKNLVIAFTVLLAVGMLSSLALAQRHGGHGMKQGRGYSAPQQGYGNYGPYPEMTQEQIQAVQKINAKYQDDLIQLQAEKAQKRAELQALLVRNQVDKSKAVSVHEDIQKIQTKIFKLRLDKGSELQKLGLGKFRGMRSGYGYHQGMMHGYGQNTGPGMMNGYGQRNMPRGPGYGPGPMHGGYCW
ncbi:MAG: periplasmic heavy metal sensor [Thermodesulfobacteriota bacterium]